MLSFLFLLHTHPTRLCTFRLAEHFRGAGARKNS